MELGITATTTIAAPEFSGSSQVRLAPGFPQGGECWCKKVTGKTAKMRRDDSEDIPRFHFYSEAGFPPYLGSIFV